MQNLLEFPSKETPNKSGREVAKKSGVNKHTLAGLAAWKQRVIQDTLLYYGHEDGGDKVVRIQVKGKRCWVQLLTADAKDAAERARQFFFDVKSKGWAEAVLRLKPAAPIKVSDKTTLADYLKAVEESHLLEQTTLYDYWRKLRTLAAGVLKIVTGHLKTSHLWSLRSGHSKFISANEQFQFEKLHQSGKLGAS